MKYQQHRGREGAGIAGIGPEGIFVIKWKGTVDSVDLKDLYKIFPSSCYIFLGHTRYATRGRKDKILQDSHPHVIGGEYSDRGDHVIIRGCRAVAIHNGTIDDAYLPVNGSNLRTDCDTEKLLHYYTEHGPEKVLKNR